MSRERHEKSERRPPVSWRPCAGVRPRSSVQLVTYHACQRSGTTCCSASSSDHLKESHDTAVKAMGKATRTAWQSTISFGQLWFIRILQLLISRECFWGEAEREWWEAEVASALHCVLWETKHPSARSPQWKSEPSNSFSPQQCKWWSWNCAGWQGSRISREFHCFVKFQAQADDAALLRNFHCNTYQRGKQVKHLSPKIQNELTDCRRKASALASAGGCKISIRIKYNNVFVPLSGVHPPTLLSCVSLPTQRNSGN